MALFFAEYDINKDSFYCNGKIEVTDDRKLKVYPDVSAPDVTEFTLDFDLVKEFVVASNIGCAMLEAELKDGDRVRICRFTQSCLNSVSEFIKAANYYIETGDYTPIDENRTKCPKCGRHYIPNTNICIHCANKVGIVSKFLSVGKKYIPMFVLSGIIVLVTNVINLFIPVLNRRLVDDCLVNSAGAKTREAVLLVIFLCLGMFACHLAKTCLNVVANRMKNRTNFRFIDDLRCQLYNKIQILSMSSISRRTTGDLIKRVTEDTSVIADFVREETSQIVETGVIFIGVLIYFLVTRPFLALLVFLPLPIALFAMSKFWHFIDRRFEKQWRRGSTANGILHDIINGIRVVKVFGTEKSEIAKFGKASEKLAQTSSENEKYWAILFPSLQFIVASGEFLILYFGAKAVLAGLGVGTSIIPPMTVGELIQVTAYAGYLYAPLGWMTRLPQAVANAVTSMAKLNEILEEDPEIVDRPDAISPKIEGNIEFENVSFGYKSYEPVLKNINLKIEKGEMVGIVGHSGVGKSTLINLIMRLYEINSGSLKIDGTDIRDISKETLCKNIGVVFQETFLFVGSIYDNILYAKPEATPEEVFAAAAIANAHDFIMRLPDSYNTVVGEHGYTLSGGERQRIAIARAVLRDPAILILDEATASLDTETESKIQEALSRLVKGRTTIAIAHRLSTLRNADRLIVLDKGKVSETGTHEELLKNHGIYYNLVMAQRQTTKMAGNTEVGQK